MSSAMIKSALDPLSCPVIPMDFTEGAWAALAGPTSKLILESLCPSRGISSSRMGISLINLWVKVEKSSALTLEAETTKHLMSGFKRRR